MSAAEPLSPLMNAALVRDLGEAQLVAAYEARKRPHWPAYEATMIDPIYSRLVLIQALHGAIERESGTRYAAPPAYVVTQLVRQDPPEEGARQSFTPRRKDDGPHWWDSI